MVSRKTEPLNMGSLQFCCMISGFEGWGTDKVMDSSGANMQIAELRDRLAAKDARIAELQAQVAELESYKGNAAHAARLDHEYFEELRHRAEFAEVIQRPTPSPLESIYESEGFKRAWREEHDGEPAQPDTRDAEEKR